MGFDNETGDPALLFCCTSCSLRDEERYEKVIGYTIH
jgi:hypothetical protein